MADPVLYKTPVEIERGEAIATLLGMLADNPDATTTYAERHGNPHLLFSPTQLVEAANIDHNIRETHGTDILVGGIMRVLVAQQRENDERRRENAELREENDELRGRVEELERSIVAAKG